VSHDLQSAGPAAMTVYKVFNSNNAVTKVSDEDLDRATAGSGPLPTELANAAGLAGRRDLLPRLHKTLGASQRLQKLAAARALLGKPALAPAREALRLALEAVRSSRADRDGKAAAKELLAELDALAA